MSLPTGKPHISFSELRDWMECSWRHKLRHVQKIDLGTPSTNLSFGTATHAVIEHFLKTKETDLSIPQKILEEDWKLYGDSEDFQKNSIEKFMAIITNIMADIPTFLNETFPGWELVEAEENLYEDLQVFFERHAGVSFKGFIDAVIRVPGKKEGQFLYWILDWKTANRPWNLQKIKDDKTRMQLVLYKKFWTTKHNVPMKDVRCGFVTIVKTSKPGKFCKLLPVSVGDVTAGKSLIVLNNGLASIKRGMALKNRDACTWCEFKNTEHCK